MFSSSDFICGGEELARLHGRQALQAGRVGGRPARTEQAGLGDPGDGDGVGLVAAEDVEVRVVLIYGEADVTTGAAFEHQHCAGGGSGVLAEQQPVARPIGIGAQRAQQRFIGQAHADAGFHEIAAPGVLARVAQAAAITLQPTHQPGPVTGLIPAQRGLGFGDPWQGAGRGD